MVSRCLPALALFGVVLACPFMASAQVNVAIVGLALEDEAPAETEREVLEALAAGLRPTASRVFFPEEIQGASPVDGAGGECEPSTCGLQAALALGAQAAITARFSQLGQLYEIEAELLLGRDRSRLGSTSLTCEACTFAEALDTVNRAGQGLRPSMPGLVTITVTPAEAAVTLDDGPIPSEPTIALAPGTHTIAASLEGYTGQSRQVTVVSGASSEVVFTLSAVPTPTSPVSAQPEQPGGTNLARSPQFWGWLSLGASIGALIPGVLWLALEGQCAIGSDEWNGMCVDVYYTWPQGLALTLVGAGLLTAAVALLVVHRRSRRRAAALRPTVAVGDRGVMMGALGTF